MNCEEAKKRLLEELGQSEPGEDLRTHIHSCEACRRDYEQSRWLRDRMLESPEIVADPHISHRLLLDYLESPDTLPPRVMDAIEGHLNECGKCRDTNEVVRRLAGIELRVPSRTESQPSRGILDRLIPVRPRLAIAAMVITLAIPVALFLAKAIWWAPGSDVTTRPGPIAVTGFVDPDQPDDIMVRHGLAGLVQKGLDEASACRVVSEDLIQDVSKRLFNDPMGVTDMSQAIEVAREAGAATLVSARKYGEADNTYVALQITDTETGKLIREERVFLRGVLSAADDIVQKAMEALASSCAARPAARIRSAGEMTTHSAVAYEHFVRGKALQKQMRRPVTCRRRPSRWTGNARLITPIWPRDSVMDSPRRTGCASKPGSFAMTARSMRRSQDTRSCSSVGRTTSRSWTTCLRR
jgi:hypothetical protein